MVNKLDLHAKQLLSTLDNHLPLLSFLIFLIFIAAGFLLVLAA